jgi:heptosyltransferase-2
MEQSFKSFLIVQTAFIGDVVLATGLIEKIHHHYPEASIDFLVRKGNEGLLKDHPHLRHILIWDKKKSKFSNLLKIAAKVRRNRYDVLINAHRYASSGFISWMSNAKWKTGFASNALSFCYDHKVDHVMDGSKSIHEVQRNHLLIQPITNEEYAKPKLYPSVIDFEKVKSYQSGKYICIAPTSVWFTKQLPPEKWIELIQSCDSKLSIYLLGAPSDHHVCESIRLASAHPGVTNLSGKLSFLESAALIAGAQMNFVNDSAPMHMASSMNAPVTAVFCSTLPSFGFGPLSDKSFVVETKEKLECRPCGSHGSRACPKGHFKCAYSIPNKDLAAFLNI